MVLWLLEAGWLAAKKKLIDGVCVWETGRSRNGKMGKWKSSIS